MSFFFGWFLWNIILIWAARRPLKKVYWQQREIIDALNAENAELRGMLGSNQVHQHLHLHGENQPGSFLTSRIP